MRKFYLAVLYTGCAAWGSLAVRLGDERKLDNRFSSGTVRSNESWDGCTADQHVDTIGADVSLKGKVVLITGGDKGLGFSTAQALYARGATVVITSLSKAKGVLAAGSLGADVKAYHLDLGSLKGVRDFAEEYHKDFGEVGLDILINNAGISGNDGDFTTVDGYEGVFQVNYLGHFLLTELLMPALRNGHGRVINVASGMANMACSKADCLKDFSSLPPVEVGPDQTQYGLSKWLMIQHAAELAEREASNGVKAFSVCPGLVDTDMTRPYPSLKKSCVGPGAQSPCPYTVDQGSVITVYAALVADQPGWYRRWKQCTAGAVEMHGFTESMRPELYQKSRTWAGLLQVQSQSQSESQS